MLKRTLSFAISFPSRNQSSIGILKSGKGIYSERNSTVSRGAASPGVDNKRVSRLDPMPRFLRISAAVQEAAHWPNWGHSNGQKMYFCRIVLTLRRRDMAQTRHTNTKYFYKIHFLGRLKVPNCDGLHGNL